MTTTPPGWYHAAGDPDGTVRWWDGTAWSDEPMPPPPGWVDPHRPVAGGRYATAWVRVGAVFIDAMISLVVLAPFMIGYFRDVFDDIDAGGDGSGIALPGQIVLVGLALSIVFLLMTAYLGATPGKLALGLRITTDDGATTPPGLRRAFLRFLPQFADALPGIGQVLSALFPIAALIMVITDHDERRSIYDRIAGTRVVHRDRIPPRTERNA